MMSCLMIDQHFLKNMPEKPSGPGDLSLGSWRMAHKISDSVKGASSESRFTEGKSNLSQLRSLDRSGGVTMTLEKCSSTMSCFCWCETAHPCPTRKHWMMFFW